MSDGERASLILASEVILASKDAIILIDEPERHLHRSISSPLLLYLHSIRPDLRWVIATHDLSLPRDDSAANILLLYGYLEKERWRAELVRGPGTISPALAEAIYGARQKVLFVEGGGTSKDAPLYRQVFNDVTIVPVGSSRDVVDAVAGLKAIPQLHHMVGRGLVDGDNRGDIGSLKKKGISMLAVYAIESIYYHPNVISVMLERSAETISLQDILDAALATLGDAEHLAKMTAYRAYRESYLRRMLDEKAFAENLQMAEVVDGPGLVSIARTELVKLKQAGNWLAIVKRYKIKASNAPDEISRKLGFLKADHYERQVLKELNENSKLRDTISSIVPNPFMQASPAAEAA